MEAIRALFGQLPLYNPSLLTGATAQTPQEELVSNRMRIRSWAMVASQVYTDTCMHRHLYAQTPVCNDMYHTAPP